MSQALQECTTGRREAVSESKMSIWKAGETDSWLIELDCLPLIEDDDHEMTDGVDYSETMAWAKLHNFSSGPL